MNLEFNVYEMNKECSVFKMLERMNPTGEVNNEFVVVGECEVENKPHLKVLHVNDNGHIKLIGDFKLDELALTVDKEDLKFAGDGIGIDSYTFDIPKENLSLDLVEDIKRLNDY